MEQIAIYAAGFSALMAVFIAGEKRGRRKSGKNITYYGKNFRNYDEEYDYTNSYKSRWLFTYREKEAFKKLKIQTDERDLLLFSKVRLLDLIEPINGTKNYNGALWKIQAKHVDFVVCNEKLIPLGIIELDDSTHDRADRIERDIFVDAVLENAGYKILHTRNVNDYTIDELLEG